MSNSLSCVSSVPKHKAPGAIAKMQVVAEGEEDEHGVLLYYKFASIPNVINLFRFYEWNCKSLSLVGRVRIAPGGVNVTVGGKMPSLEKHISALKSNDLFEDTDFKLAPCHSPSNENVAKECGFTSLSIRVVEELVTFSPHPFLKSPAISNAGRHLSAIEFHSALQKAGNSLESNGINQSKRLVLLDARNIYETRIGKFRTPNVETLDPNIRQYSDLPAWIDKHSEQLCGNHILMYCTGGIRCEMASAYIRSKGPGFENAFQLYGGIQRYLEQFPDGGFFKGKNFVFDYRISVGSSDVDIIGSCLLCGLTFDDYSSRCRCAGCRMLVLVCRSCQVKASSAYLCELCQKHGRNVPMQIANTDSQVPMNEEGDGELKSSSVLDHITLTPRDVSILRRKLRILCLHGFRQNASNFKGRTASLAKKLKNIAELVYVDAPHELPYIYQVRPLQYIIGPDKSSQQTSKVPADSQHPPPPGEACKKRFAWLVAAKSSSSCRADWTMAEEPFDPLQYQQQTEGFDESYAFLKSAISEMGPFDGALGFSQGASMAALLCAQQESENSDRHFRFVILCSGFPSNTKYSMSDLINCPSLHIFGNGQGMKDRQIARDASMALLGCFDKRNADVIEHNSGHIIPTQSPYIDQFKNFLERFR